MKTKILSSLVFAALLCGFCGNALADSPAAATVAATKPELKNFPATKPEAFYKDFEKIYTFAPNGSCEIRTKSRLRVETLFAVNNLCGETFVVYNPRFQRVKVNEGYTLLPSGKRVPLPENALNEVLPAAAANAPDFNFLRELVITHTALEPGAEIYLDYSIFYDSTAGILFDENSELPFPCEHLVFNFNGAITEKSNVPARSREAFFFPKKDVPVMYPGMEFEEKDIYTDRGDKLDKAGTKIFSDIASDDLGKEDKIAALYKFVQEKIATVKVAPELLNFELRAPETVLQTGYGVPAEKARLLRLLLKTVAPEDEWEMCRDFDYDTFFVLRRKNSGGQNRYDIEPQSGFANGICENAEVEISPEKQTLRGKISQKNMTPLIPPANISEPKKFFAELLGEKESDIKQSVVTRDGTGANELAFEISREEKISELAFIWRVPVSKKGLAASGWDKLPAERQSEFTVSKLDGDTEIFEGYEFRIATKDGVSFAGEPANRVLRNELGEVRFSVEKDGATIVVAKSFRFSMKRKFPVGKILPADYSKFRELLREWFAPQNNRVLFRVTPVEEKEKGK
ncbi:MAG: DUF3857 domain-containing protein [Opitutae bacterium]|nr:DUF3857 domain-containing protein [Opitutae bacterium]